VAASGRLSFCVGTLASTLAAMLNAWIGSALMSLAARIGRSGAEACKEPPYRQNTFLIDQSLDQ